MTGTKPESNGPEYDNPVFDETIRGDHVTNGGHVPNGDDVKVFRGSTEEDLKKENEKADRYRTTSFSPSIDYGDVITAEQLTDDVMVGSDFKKNSSPSNNHHRVHSRRASVGFVRSVGKSRDSVTEDEFYHRELILKIRKTLPLKNFKDEIRARRDLEKFLVKPVVLLDTPHTNLDQIVDALMKKLQKDLEVDESITSQAGKNFFTFQEEWENARASVDQLRETIQGVGYNQEGANYEETWVTALCSLPMLKKSHVGIARLKNPLNLGNKCEEVKFVIAVIAPKKEKFTKNAVEIGRTFSSIMYNPEFRLKLLDASCEEDFKAALSAEGAKFKKQHSESFSDDHEAAAGEADFEDYRFIDFGRGVLDDLKRRLPHYWSDYKDGIVGKHTIHKLVATVFFLYFACLLPDIAFGTLYEKNTEGKIDVVACILSQTIGGLFFAIFSGQPMLVLLTTAPLALYVKVVFLVSETFSLDFLSMYTLVGIWNGVFLAIQSLFNVSKLMKYSSRSTEEIFGFFIALAFTADAIKATKINFEKNYHFESTSPSPVLANLSTAVATTTDAMTSPNTSSSYPEGCVTKDFCFRPENSVLFLFLMLGTLWLGMTLLRFEDSQFLSSTKREILKDYALAITVLFFTFIGSYVFRGIQLEAFNFSGVLFEYSGITGVSIEGHFLAVGLGLCLSILFFVDQNVSAALVNAPENKLKKGPAYHWDLLVVAVINIFLSLFKLPWVHAALPHSPLHVKALADVEQHVSSVGTVTDEIVRVRETRLTTIFSHILIGLSLLFIPILQYIPVAVLQGLFLFIGFSSFGGNQFFDRLLLFFTEGSSYPPNHYVRKVPQRTLHLFTICQIVQLVIVSAFGFADQFYLKMVFPILILLLLPVRHKILPLFIERKYLAVLDS